MLGETRSPHLLVNVLRFFSIESACCVWYLIIIIIIVIIIIKRISRAPIYHTRWETRALYNNTNDRHTQIHTDTQAHTHTQTHTHSHTHARTHAHTHTHAKYMHY